MIFAAKSCVWGTQFYRNMEHTGRRNEYKVSKSDLLFLYVTTSSKTARNIYSEDR